MPILLVSLLGVSVFLFFWIIMIEFFSFQWQKSIYEYYLILKSMPRVKNQSRCKLTDFLLKFSRTQIPFVGSLIALLVTAVLGFQSINCQIHLWRDTCWPLGGQQGSRTFLTHALASVSTSIKISVFKPRNILQCSTQLSKEIWKWCVNFAHSIFLENTKGRDRICQKTRFLDNYLLSINYALSVYVCVCSIGFET